MSNHRILKRKYYALEIELASPLCVSSGVDGVTDSDVMINGSGEPFIPGSSLAGAMRSYLDLKKDKPGFFGYAKEQQGRMSSVTVSDFFFTDENIKISVRDRIKLTEDKIVENGKKFDMEIIETGAKGILFLNYVIRDDSDNESVFEKGLSDVFRAIQDGSVRFGSVKSRGFGQFRILSVREKSFTCGSGESSVKDWIDFNKNARDTKRYGEKQSYNEWLSDHKQTESGNYIRITVPLKQDGGISIRTYSTRPEEADFEQLTCNGKPVIPGTSWNGAIRSDAREILCTLSGNEDQADWIIESWFGKASEKDETSWQSRVFISESVIRDAVSLPMTRTKINRFDDSTISGALYSEISCFKGNTELEIMIRKEDPNSAAYSSYLALLAVLDLVIKDIQSGFLAIGGETAIGRGIFKDNGEIEYSEGVEMEKCYSSLYSLTSQEDQS